MNDGIHHAAPFILRMRNVQVRTLLARSAIYQRMKVGEFVVQITLGLRAVGCLETKIEKRVAPSRNDWTVDV